MITATQAHIDLLQSRRFSPVEMYRITLIDGTVLRYSNGMTVTWNSETFQGGILQLSRGTIRLVRGLEVDSMTVNIVPRDGVTLYALPWRSAVINGALDGARLELLRGHYSDPASPLVGAILRYSGEIQSPVIKDEIELTVKSDLYRLDAPVPRAVFGPGCDRTLFDAGCGLSRAAYQLNTSLVSGSSKTIVKLLAPAPNTTFYTGGEVRFTGGLNAGARRQIKRQIDLYSFLLSYPLVNAVSIGDALSVWPGCARTKEACAAFSNSARFRGQPYIPQPETIL